MRVIYDLVRDGLSAINGAADRLNAARQEVATGMRVRAASDDPLAMAQAVGEHSTLRSIDAYTRTADSASARLAATDNTLGAMIDKITAAIVAGTASRGSTVPASARAANAATVRGLRESLVADINFTFNGNYLFAGTATATKPYELVAGAWTYQGNNDTMRVEVERGRSIATSFDGQSVVQGADAKDMFAALDDLAAAIEAGDNDAMGAEIAALERAFDRTTRAQGALGSDAQSIDAAGPRLTALRQAAEARRSKLEDANLAEAVVRLSQAETAYDAALGAVSAVERRSLLDYLK